MRIPCSFFWGGEIESSTLKELSETLGRETIDLYNTSDTRGQSRSYGLNYQKTGKDMPYLFVKSSDAHKIKNNGRGCDHLISSQISMACIVSEAGMQEMPGQKKRQS